MTFAINNTANEFTVGGVYEVKCGNEFDTIGIEYRHMEVLQLQDRMCGKVALMRDMADSKYLGVGTISTSTGKVECTNARVVGKFGFDSESDCIKSLGFKVFKTVRHFYNSHHRLAKFFNESVSSTPLSQYVVGEIYIGDTEYQEYHLPEDEAEKLLNIIKNHNV